MKVVEVASGRATLAVAAAGDGIPVALLHAGVADRRMWRAQAEALAAAGFRAIAYDRRGHGDSLHADEAYSHVRDLVAVLDSTGRRMPAILVGCSQGGRIAIDAALAHPERVRGLVLVAPAVSGAPEPASFPPAIQAWIDRVDRAEATSDIDRINALEAHAWLDGPLAREGRVGGPVRELFLAMNEIALRASSRLRRGIGSRISPHRRSSRGETSTFRAWSMPADTSRRRFRGRAATCSTTPRTCRISRIRRRSTG